MLALLRFIDFPMGATMELTRGRVDSSYS